MNYIFKLLVARERSKLALLQDEKEVGAIEWPEERDMGRKLFEAIQELLEKDNLKPEEIGEFVVESELPEHSTSRRIAETVQKVYSFAVQFPKTQKRQ